MATPHLLQIKSEKLRRGVAAVEFALVLIPFLLLLLGVMEFGRLLYLWNTAQEVTRNAARKTVVTDFNNGTAINSIKYSAVFRSAPGALPAGPEITNANVIIRYLNASGNLPGTMPSDPGDNISACLDATRVNDCIRYVEVCVGAESTCQTAVTAAPWVGLISGSWSSFTIPLSTVRMPVESLGFRPL